MYLCTTLSISSVVTPAFTAACPASNAPLPKKI